jgi:hypothetical protein
MMQTILSDELIEDPKPVIFDLVDPYLPGRDSACCDAKFRTV